MAAGLTGVSRYGIALGAGVALMSALGVAVALSYHPVRPRVLCAMPLGTGELAVYFGYSNEAEDVVFEPLGPDNHITPGGSPPTEFARGSSGTYPRAAFVVTASSQAEIAWTVGPRTARYDEEETARCPIPQQKPAPEDVVWVPPKPAVTKVEPPPPPPKEEPPPPPPKEEVAEAKTPPKLGDKTPQPVQKKPPPKPAQVEAPVALALDGLSNLDSGIGIQKGEYDTLGDPEVEAKPETNTPREVGDPNGTPGGQGVEPAREPKRVAAKVKSRPKGEWPADAPPRAGSVLVRLSLLVGTDGTVKQVKVVRGAGPAFDREAKAVGARAVFSPATIDGEPVETWVPWDVEFTPDEF